MTKVRMFLMTLVAVFVAGAAASAVASAQEGPVWHVAGKVLKAGETDAIVDRNVAGTVATLKGTVAGAKITIICNTVASTGKLIGGNPGKDQEEIAFSNCSLEGQPACTVVVDPTHAWSELDHLGSGPESKKMLTAFYTNPATKEPFTTIHITGSSCLSKVTAEVTIETRATYGVACENSPEEKETKVLTLHCPTKAIAEEEQGGTKVKVGLRFANEPATFAAQIEVEQVSKELFGIFQV